MNHALTPYTVHSNHLIWFIVLTCCHKTKTSSSAMLEGVWQRIRWPSGSSEGVWQWIKRPSGSSITIVQTGGEELVELHDSIRPLSLRILCLLPSFLSFDFSPSSFKRRLISLLEVESVTVGRGMDALRFASDSSLGVLLSVFVSMSSQCTTFPGFLGVPELTLRVHAGFSWGGHFFRR